MAQSLKEALRQVAEVGNRQTKREADTPGERHGVDHGLLLFDNHIDGHQADDRHRPQPRSQLPVHALLEDERQPASHEAGPEGRHVQPAGDDSRITASSNDSSQHPATTATPPRLITTNNSGSTKYICTSRGRLHNGPRIGGV